MTQQLHLEIWVNPVQRLYPDVIWVLWQYSVVWFRDGSAVWVGIGLIIPTGYGSAIIWVISASIPRWLDGYQVSTRSATEGCLIVAKMKTLKLTLSHTHWGWFPNFTMYGSFASGCIVFPRWVIHPPLLSWDNNRHAGSDNPQLGHNLPRLERKIHTASQP